jgi:dihydrofolate reductase
MAKVIASITTSVDGYIAGPDDGPGKGLGEGGERLHYWVFDGPWSYDNEPKGEPSGEALEFLNRAMARTGAIVVGRWMYEAAGHWGDKNPWDIPVFVVTHRPQEEPDTGEFNFVGGFDEAIERARDVAGDKNVAIGGGADVIRQGLDAGGHRRARDHRRAGDPRRRQGPCSTGSPSPSTSSTAACVSWSGRR